AFADGDLIRRLARGLQKRVAIRPDPSALVPIEQAEPKVRAIVPAEAGIADLSWAATGELTLEVQRPGLAIGAQGVTLNRIRAEVGWNPRVVRTPPIPSRTVREVREFLRSNAEERRRFLRRVGRRMHRSVSEGDRFVRMTALGAWREVGRSCSMLQTQDSKVLVDCGVKFEESDPATPMLWLGEVQPFTSLDAVVLTHGHLDHCGLVPLLFKYGYEGPVYCTPPTRDILALLAIDYIRVAEAQGGRKPYDAEHVRQALLHTIPVEWGETTDVAPDLRLTLHDAGHILGSSVAHFHVGEGLYNVAFSGDIKYERSWLFNPAHNKFPRLDAVIVESTYGGKENNQPSRVEAAEQTKKVLLATAERKGKTVFPVFAVGRSQEVMLVIEELMRTGQVPRQPVYLDGMIWEATALHTCYPEYLNDGLKQKIFQQNENPLLSPIFKRIDSHEMRQRVCADPDPCIVLATSGMLTGGPVLEYMKHWADDPRNTLCFVGFNAEGSLGRKLQRGFREMPIQEGGQSRSIRVEMALETIDGFSGHCDRRQLMNFIQNMDPQPKLVLTGHGEAGKCIDLAQSIQAKFNIEARSLQNAETIRFR
ncbi:MAG TPA: beta-CASP ribonuclease aCPSF1, partial [Candidatus Thermoplasmatota archaeon]|nr:beta-CASP ribonuclease aCPSF1 [Candidatus Thermoplasmatota archaeon]